MLKSNELRKKRRIRTRRKLREVSAGRSRLSVFRSNKQIYAQVIDDERGHTVAAASTLDKDLRETLKSGGTVDSARAVGKLLAERALAAGVKHVVFDRGQYLYHGRIKALAEACREVGLDF